MFHLAHQGIVSQIQTKQAMSFHISISYELNSYIMKTPISEILNKEDKTL